MLQFKIPIPPTLNKSLASINGRLVKTAGARNFRLSVDAMFAKFNYQERTYLQNYVNSIKDEPLSVELVFLFDKEDVLNKNVQKSKVTKKFKTLDIDNRIKPAIDAIFENLGHNDCHIFEIIIKKRIRSEGQDKCAMIKIVKMENQDFSYST